MNDGSGVLDIFDDTTPANCYANSQCLGGSLATSTVGSCCNNSVDPIGFSYQTASGGCQACPTGQIVAHLLLYLQLCIHL